MDIYRIQRLQKLSKQLQSCSDDAQRIHVLDSYLQGEALPFQSTDLSSQDQVVIKSLIAIGQENLVNPSLLKELLPVEHFYKDMGGIVGYHTAMLTLLHQDASQPLDELFYHRPFKRDISCDTEEVRHYVIEGIRSLAYLAELYPVGGAADRLNLIDLKTQMPLPAAQLRFCGKTLLETLITDVQAREYLYYKLFAKQIIIPIAMMTSQEKDNHYHILRICEENNWFGRSKESFHFFCQPAVPLMDKEGKWCLSEEKKLLMKPGGHGVIWKMARESGLFKQWQKQGIKKLLVRQINNPIAGCDHGLLCFTGIGFSEDKAFGFASCPRQINAAEGINVLLQRKSAEQNSYCLTNVEYCHFKKRGIEDKPDKPGSPYSLFPSNTNILFADISFIEQALEKTPLPGMIVNQEREKVRLESTMQHIADVLVAEEKECESLKTFLTYNLRSKTISTTKREYIPGNALLETPQGCFYDLLHNAYDLLTHFCHFKIPVLPSHEGYIQEGPSFIFLYHPALGPLYSIIGQKLRGGLLTEGSELQLDIADIYCESLTLEGSLVIRATHIMGDIASDGTLRYSDDTGKCLLKRVKVRNEGIDRQMPQEYWKNEIVRKELCEIIIHGNGEFIAEDVTLQGALRIQVPEGYRVRAVQDKEKVVYVNEKINTSLLKNKYSLCGNRIVVTI